MIQNLLLYVIICCSFTALYFIYHSIVFPKPLPIGLGLIIVLALTLAFPSQPLHIYIYFVSIISFLLSLHSRVTERIHDFILIFLMSECFTGIWECILSWVVWKGELRDNALFLPKLLTFILCLLILVIKLYCTRFFTSLPRISSERIRKALYYTIILMAIGMMFTISALRHAYNTSELTGYRIVLIFIIFIAYLSIGGTAIIYSYVTAANKKVHELLQQEQLSNLMQKEYYTTLLDMEADTKKYRHDINNHLITISHMARSGDVNEIIEYISSMQENLDEIRSRVRLTGNTLVDILTNYYLSRLPSSDFFNIQGLLPETLPIDPYLFNTAYANHLQNAVEAIIGMSNSDIPKLNVTFSLGEQYFRYVIENSFNEGNPKQYLQRNNSKKDHGFGTSNATSAINQLHGQINTSVMGDTFMTTVVIPIPPSINHL